MHELPDEYLADAMPLAKKIALAQGAENYNVLQNNGALAHQVIVIPRSSDPACLLTPLFSTKQVVPHVHWHVIPKPDEKEGLIVGWPAKEMDKQELQKVYEELKGKL